MSAEYSLNSPDKIGLDDYLLTHTAEDFENEVLMPARNNATNSRLQRTIDESGLAILTDSSLEKVKECLEKLIAGANSFDQLERQLLREAAIKELRRLGFSSPASLYDSANYKQSQQIENSNNLDGLFGEEIEPWPEPVNSDELINEIQAVFLRFLMIPQGMELVLALWVIHTWIPECSFIYPILDIFSPRPRCGKTLFLEILEALVYKPLMSANISTASLFRIIDKYSPTMLIDEADTYFKERHELRGIINAGHRRGGKVFRCVGDDNIPKPFSVWGPKAIAAIGMLPPTLKDRGLPVQMMRKKPSEKVDRWRPDKHPAQLIPIKRKILRWKIDNLDLLQNADPDVPDTLQDRAQDNWRPLLAIAKVASQALYDKASQAALTLSGNEEEEDAVTGQLLADLYTLFASGFLNSIPTSQILASLHDKEDRPWGSWKFNKPMNSQQLAYLLRPYGVRPRQTWQTDILSNVRGYHLADLEEAFDRYLPERESIKILRQKHRETSKQESDSLSGSPRLKSPFEQTLELGRLKYKQDKGKKDRQKYIKEKKEVEEMIKNANQ